MAFEMNPTARMQGRIKCVVWDLDGTIWNGVLLEDAEVAVKEHVIDVIRQLDNVGILHSISSKNDHDLAMARLEKASIAEYFLYPQITWNPKSDSMRSIAASLGIGVDALALVDDQEFELREVGHALPEVLLVRADEVAGIVSRPEFRPGTVTRESRERRRKYLASMARDDAERGFAGTSEEFLATLGMKLSIRQAGRDDLQRAEELTVRTNQLNSTGRTFGFAELDVLRTSSDHVMLLASLEDRFGSYGKIGLALIHTGESVWTLRLLLVSCRVVSRGVGTVLLNHVMRLAKDAGVRLHAEFVDTGRNRLMYLTYKLAGFYHVDSVGEENLLESALADIQPPPSYLTMDAEFPQLNT
jgi:FkbH-like protein